MQKPPGEKHRNPLVRAATAFGEWIADIADFYFRLLVLFLCLVAALMAVVLVGYLLGIGMEFAERTSGQW